MTQRSIDALRNAGRRMSVLLWFGGARVASGRWSAGSLPRLFFFLAVSPGFRFRQKEGGAEKRQASSETAYVTVPPRFPGRGREGA